MSASVTNFRYDVVALERGGVWSVAIVDHDGTTVVERACRDAAEARTFASTVRQHRYWLSDDRFREYYGLTDGGAEAPPASSVPPSRVDPGLQDR